MFIIRYIILIFNNILDSFVKAGTILQPSTTSILLQYPFPNSQQPPTELILQKHQLSQYLNNKRIYFQSQRWQTLRQYRLQLDNYKCKECGINYSLNIHHLNYRSLFNETVSDVVTLCASCHTFRHEKVGYPQTVEEYLLFNDTLV